MFENAGNILTATLGGTGRIVTGTGIKYTGAGIRKVGEILVTGGSWLETQGTLMAAKGKAVKLISNGQLTVLGAAALAAGQNVVEVMTAEILSGQPLNMMGAEPATTTTTHNDAKSPKETVLEVNPTEKEEIPPAELAADLC